MNRQTLTVKELAQYLGVHSDLIYSMVRNQAIPHFKLNSKILFLKTSIDAWINEQEITTK